MNLTEIIGTITRDIELKETESGVKYTRFSIAVNRRFKNENGEYDTDLLKVKMGFNNPNINEYITNGSLIGIKGRIENINDQNIIIAEKITFLSGKDEVK